MSKSARKHAPARKPRKHIHEPKPVSKFKIKSSVIAIVVTVVLAAIPFAMGKYIEFNSPDPFDSGCYVYSAQHILNGARIGIDEKPSAQMGTLLINILGVRLLGFNEIGPKLIQMLLQMAAFVLMFIAMRKLFGTLAASVGVIIASIYLSAPLIAKFGNVKEQHMIAFMIMGMSCFVLYQLNGKWWCAIPAGAFLSFAPLFKETGTSALGAVGLFLILQPFFKHSSWKKTGIDILLLVAGAVAILVPISLWLAVQRAPINYYPYSFLYRSFFTSHLAQDSGNEKESVAAENNDTTAEKPAAKQGLILKLLPGYVSDSWLALDPEARKEVRLRVFRYYRLLILPIVLALGSIILRIVRFISSRKSKSKGNLQAVADRFVLLFAVWWVLDMSFVWISPRLYEQYFLPLNASAAMLGGYLIGSYSYKAKEAVSKPAWIAIGVVGLLIMIFMSLHIFRGVLRSPHSGIINRNRITGQPERYRGYAQRLAEARSHGQGSKNSAEVVGEYIKNNSTPSDEIYVWGWFPGIYISAQRFSPAPKAFEGTMNVISPKLLSERIEEILNSFKKKPPKFIVDSRKNHFPWDRPPLELWPSIQNGLMLVPNRPADRKQLWYALLRTLDVQPDDLTEEGFLRADKPDGIRRYDAAFAKALRAQIDPVEAQRYEVMKPFRDYVMTNYRIVRMFGQHVLFQRK
jgi:hypothetical protein